MGTITRDLKVDISLNQVGFLPRAFKKCVVPGREATEFAVLRTDTHQVAYRGALQPSEGDFGAFSGGEFSVLQTPGTYYVQVVGLSRSWPFRIAHDAYDGLLQTMVRYFSLQRCGPSSTGYLAPCHLDDGIRLDNGMHQDVSGGWHDASDLRKWVGATIFGMIGLARLYETLRPAWDRGQIMDELRWGNRYFLNMQEPVGYVMSHVGGDALRHADSNRWTDNRIGDEGGEVRTVDPLPGGTSVPATVVGNSDDRVIQTKPLDRPGQYHFIIAQAMMARLAQPDDPIYARRCREAAVRCFGWCVQTGGPNTTSELGAALQAAIDLYRATGEQRYVTASVSYARLLAALQVKTVVGEGLSVRGYFQTSPADEAPYRDIWHGCWPLIALAELYELLPAHPEAPMWREVMALYCEEYLLSLAGRNHFDIVPYALDSGTDLGEKRRAGRFQYRYFMEPVEGWWVGINANLASTGVGLLRAERILWNPRLRDLAQRQLDWIVGSNPLNASTIEAIGHNHPAQFVNSNEFRPATPRLPGAVMNGLGGTMEDQPAPYDGSYHTAEYWTPMAAFTMWLLAELAS